MERVIEKLERETTPLTSSVERDEFITASETAFDCKFDGFQLFIHGKSQTTYQASLNWVLLLVPAVLVNQLF